MADITMCDGVECPIKDKCYRHTAPKSKLGQSYFWGSPMKDGKCIYFWDEKTH